ncbi:putative cationic amino acid transporter [Convolutriloba macropyga]|uniref:putative cationic amino acid transporter n=1 Tax=Convolutriloba macropyga TaxID=536237 RepID=UPI003F528F91
MPKAGSRYVYVYATLGELAAFIVGWTTIFTRTFDTCVACRGIVSYVNEVADNAFDKISPNLFVEHNWDLYSSVSVVCVTIAACFGIKKSAWFNTGLAFVNIGTIFFVIICGFILADFSNWNEFLPFGVSSIFKGAANAYFAFSGYSMITVAAEEATEPSKSVPIALIVTIVFLTITYSMLTALMTLMIPYTGKNCFL